ncbi:F-box and WD repeat domain containing protein [Pseudohyphozyma bogoriensis]|nr:F-box and WD repeat domain containing protein [Pseudohyphozyma bogoriensis]
MGKRSRDEPGHEPASAAASRSGVAQPKKRHGGSLTFRDIKRARTSRKGRLTLEGALSEELLLNVLSFLSAEELVVVARVSTQWHRLSQDPQLWRALYLSTFASSRRTPLSPPTRTQQRPWRELYKISKNWRSGNARPTVLGLRKSVLAEAPADLEIAGGPSGGEELEQVWEPAPSIVGARGIISRNPTPPRPRPDTILQFHQHWFLTASRRPSPRHSCPSVSVHQTLPSGDSTLVGTISSLELQRHYSTVEPPIPLSITEMRLDERVDHHSDLHLAVFFSTGQFSLFRLHLPTTTSDFSYRELYCSLAIVTRFPGSAAPPPSSFDPTVLARFHSPLLVTTSSSFTLRFWRVIPGADDTVTLEEAEPGLRSRESWWPVVLTLAPVEAPPPEVDEDDPWPKPAESKLPAQEIFKVSLCYSTPIFPSSWSVGLQEFVVTVPTLLPPSPGGYHPPSRVRITARHAIAPAHRTIVPTSLSQRARWSDDGLVTAVEYSGKWICASRSDNTIDLWEVISSPQTMPTPPPSSHSTIRISTALPAPSTLAIRHRRTLFGHTARVHSVAVDDRRCVSGGADGVKVWDLGPASAEAVTVSEEQEEKGAHRTLAQDLDALQVPAKIRTVFFDESKIVTIMENVEGRREGNESVKVLRFD